MTAAAGGPRFGPGCWSDTARSWGFHDGGGFLPASALHSKVVTLVMADGTVHESVRVTGYRYGPGLPGTLTLDGQTDVLVWYVTSGHWH